MRGLLQILLRRMDGRQSAPRRSSPLRHASMRSRTATARCCVRCWRTAAVDQTWPQRFGSKDRRLLRCLHGPESNRRPRGRGAEGGPGSHRGTEEQEGSRGAGGGADPELGIPEFFNFSSEQDAKDSTQEIAGLDQGGLGLPDRDYYFKTDPKSVEQRAAYVAHVAKMFQLLGSSAADAAKKGANGDGDRDRAGRRVLRPGHAARSGEGVSQDDREGAGHAGRRISNGPSFSTPSERLRSRAWTSRFRRL